MSVNGAQLAGWIEARWPGRVRCEAIKPRVHQAACERSLVAELSAAVFRELDFAFAGLVVEEGAAEWALRYIFYDDGEAGWLHVTTSAPLEDPVVPSIATAGVFAADWDEREAEDMYGMRFEGHPRLGDFVMHDDVWQEDVRPMRRGFDAAAALRERRPDEDWRPRRVVQEAGAFVMPIGPKFSGITESVHFLLETVGEDVIRSWTRLFYKWRAIEKLAEGRSIEDALEIAERFAATTAFAHGFAYCRAVESICAVGVPPRARALRVFLAELERLRHHAGAIQEICESTALAVANAQAAILEEELLRVSGELTGHRYLFGMLAPGGLLTDLSTRACEEALLQSRNIVARMRELERLLRISSSFLDRLEEVGAIWPKTARSYSLLGPVARASGLARDLRRVQPYGGYDGLQFEVAREEEGDGYARLRVLLFEAYQSLRLMEQAAAALSEGPVRVPVEARAGAALGWVEAPRGGTFHWVRLDEAGRIARYHAVTPSFVNWHSFHLAAEKFAFQDFPIILATFDLSVAENDR